MEHPIIITSSGKIINRANYNIISKYLFTTAGRQKLAQSMIAPIQRRLNYQAVSRQVLPVQSMPLPGSLIYNSDPKVEDIVIPPAEKYKFDAIKISPSGEVYRKGRYPWGARKVTVPMFQLVSNPTIRLGSVKRRRFPIMDRATLKLKESIKAEEDSRIFDMLDKLSSKK